MVIENGGVTNFKMGSLFMHSVPTCCIYATLWWEIKDVWKYSWSSYSTLEQNAWI